MGIDPPAPPDPTDRGTPAGLVDAGTAVADADLRRGELETALRDGAWEEAVREWAAYTDLSRAEYRAVERAGLIARLDVYRDPVERRLRHGAPSVPARLGTGAGLEPGLPARARAELADLGRTVVETLADGYVDWEEAATGERDWDERPRGDADEALAPEESEDEPDGPD
jgi:hypothetical protein